MKNKVVYSEKQDVNDAVSEIKYKLAGEDVKLIVYFASYAYPSAELSQKMAEAFPGVETVGSTSCKEYSNEKLMRESIMAMAFGSDALKRFKVAVAENITKDQTAIPAAFESFSEEIGCCMRDADPSRYVGLVLINGMTDYEEIINDQLGNLTNVPFVGGTAGNNFAGGTAADNMNLVDTYLFHNGKIYENSTILVLLEPTNGYYIQRMQSVEKTGKLLTPTKVEGKTVVEFDNKPAVTAFSEALGIPEKEYIANFQRYMLGLVFDEEHIFLSLPWDINNTDLTFFSLVREGLPMHILKAVDILENSRVSFENIKKKCGDASAVIVFDCSSRIFSLQAENKTGEYVDVYKGIPTLGFGTIGESYIGHTTYTAVVLLLK